MFNLKKEIKTITDLDILISTLKSNVPDNTHVDFKKYASNLLGYDSYQNAARTIQEQTTKTDINKIEQTLLDEIIALKENDDDSVSEQKHINEMFESYFSTKNILDSGFCIERGAFYIQIKDTVLFFGKRYSILNEDFNNRVYLFTFFTTPLEFSDCVPFDINSVILSKTNSWHTMLKEIEKKLNSI